MLGAKNPIICHYLLPSPFKMNCIMLTILRQMYNTSRGFLANKVDNPVQQRVTVHDSAPVVRIVLSRVAVGQRMPDEV